MEPTNMEVFGWIIVAIAAFIGIVVFLKKRSEYDCQVIYQKQRRR